MSEIGGQQIAFGASLDPFPAWTSLEESLGLRVSGWRINRGRVDETQRTGTGTASIFVNDLEGYFGLGSEFPSQARLLLRGSPRFRGYVDEVNVEVVHTTDGDLSRVTIECSDMFEYLSRAQLMAGVHGHFPVPAGQEQYVYYEVDQVDDRIIDTLFSVGILSAQRSVFSGNVELLSKTYPSGTTAMQVIDECADAEWPGVSNRFCDGTGRFCFRGRFARFNPSDPTYGIQFWEAGTGSSVTTGRAQIRRLRYGTKRSLIVNSAIAYPEGTAEANAPLTVLQNVGSIGNWGERSWTAENLLTKRHLSNGNTGADEAILFATYQVQNYNAPRARVDRVQFRTLRDEDPRAADTWDLMCGVEIGDVLDIYPGGTRYFVEGITLEARELDGDIPYAVCDLDLSPAAFWTVDPF